MNNNRRFNQYRKLIDLLGKRTLPNEDAFGWFNRTKKVIDAARRKLMPWGV